MSQDENKKHYDWSDKTILIADDEYMNFLLFEAILEETGAKVIHNMNGEMAIEEVKNNPDNNRIPLSNFTCYVLSLLLYLNTI